MSISRTPLLGLLLGLTILGAGCGHRSALTPVTPNSSTSSTTVGSHGKIRHTKSIQPNSCAFGSDGSINCASNCVGQWDAGGTPDETCTFSGNAYSVTGPSGLQGGTPLDNVTIPGPVGNINDGYQGTPIPPDGNYTWAQKIWHAAQKFRKSHSQDKSTRGLYGAPLGNECVATVQAILYAAGLPLYTNQGVIIIGVDLFRAKLAADPNWVKVPTSQAVQGDIVVQGDGYPGYGPGAGQNHVGICETRGCTYIISNSSHHGAFVNEQSLNAFNQEYSPVLPEGVWHHI